MQRRFCLNGPVFLVLVALFITLSGNYRFFNDVLLVYPATAANLPFLLSLTGVVFALLLLVTSLLSLILPLRLAATLMLLWAAVVGHFGDDFGVVVDTEMIRNTLQTDAGEAGDLLNGAFALRLLLLGLLPCALVWKIPLKSRSFMVAQLVNAGMAGAALAMVVVWALPMSAQYSVFLREHKHLRFYINPLAAMVSAGAYANQEWFDTPPPAFLRVAKDASLPPHEGKPELVIMVVGETARADRFALNGYGRPTNPELEKLDDIVSFSAISSCGTSTAVSVPCMFSIADKDDFDLKEERHRENVLDVLQRVGVSVLWRDNNSSSKGVADRVAYQDFRHPGVNPVCDEECRDVGMLSGLQDYIDRQKGDILIVLHQMGNHGPAYFKRYPSDFEYFKPACRSVDLSTCSTDEINNAYDNAIRYTDYFLAQVIALLKTNAMAHETAMLYISDHGESLGENGLYLHGAPYFMAPETQTHVPAIFWRGGALDLDWAATLRNKDRKNSHDAVFTSLLEIFEVHSSVVQGRRALFEVEES
ncbi:phosphoethanolamine transferase [Spongiibacter marinus]|uniref:phosphoethanolamine transferase n=1 Tax=Spongiibacter marinus TaxID=354246 RepID=UPI003C3F3B8E